MNARLKRIRVEAAYAAARFSRSRKAQVDPQGGWVILYDFILPPGLYNYETVDILIELPPDYPLIPPQWFYTDPGLRRRDGRDLQHYFEHRLRNGWAAGCLHIRTWQPGPDPLHGHSLLTVGQLIYDAFCRWGR